MSYSFISIAINKKLTVDQIFDNNKYFIEGGEKNDFYLEKKSGKFESFVNIYHHSFLEFITPHLHYEEHLDKFKNVLEERFALNGSFFCLCFSNKIDVFNLLDNFLEYLHINYKEEDCIIITDKNETIVYELADFYSKWKNEPFFWAKMDNNKQFSMDIKTSQTTFRSKITEILSKILRG
jgi:hypothetical protein